MTKEYKGHYVREEDKHRIKCSSHRWHSDCEKSADVCIHLDWNTGNTTGMSFIYLCSDGAKSLSEATGDVYIFE